MATETDDDAADYALFGKILLLWGHVETALVKIVLRLTHPLFGLPNHQGVPDPFSQKIKLAKRGYRDIPAMSPLRDQAREAFGALSPLSKTRNIIVHGYYQGLTGADRYMFSTYVQRSQTPGFKSYYFAVDDVAKLASDINASRQELDDLTTKTFRIALPRVSRRALPPLNR
jgi:hypothetical protein